MTVAMRILAGLLVVGFIVGTTAKRDGTPRHLREIFVGRCAEFLMRNKRSTAECDDHWQRFSASFAGKAPTRMVEADYEDFVAAASGEFDDDQTVLFARTNGLVKQLIHTNKQHRSIFDTLAGYVADDLAWCGRTDSETDGINYDSCPSKNSNFPAFWGAASIQFAKQAKGEVYIVLNGSHPDPLRNYSSMLITHEIPNLDSKRVTLVKALVVHDPQTERGGDCNSEPFSQLRKKVEAVGLKFECVDDPPTLQALLCVGSLRVDAKEFCSLRPVQQPECCPSGWKIGLVLVSVVGISKFVSFVSS